MGKIAIPPSFFSSADQSVFLFFFNLSSHLSEVYGLQPINSSSPDEDVDDNDLYQDVSTYTEAEFSVFNNFFINLLHEKGDSVIEIALSFSSLKDSLKLITKLNK